MGAYEQFNVLSGHSSGLQGTVLWEVNVYSNNHQCKIHLSVRKSSLNKKEVQHFIHFLADKMRSGEVVW